MKWVYILSLVISISLCGCSKEEERNWNEECDISVMTFNLRYDEPADEENQWDNRKEACLKMLNKTGPSVFGIQEGLHNQVRYLDENLSNYNYIGVGRDDGYSSGEYAAIFYDNRKFDLQESNTFWLSETPEYPSLGWDANNIRCVTWAHLKDLDHDGKSIYIFNTHFDHKGKEARTESAKLLLEKISEIADVDASVFITGDLNTLISNEALEPILEQFFSARRFAEYTDGKYSFNAFGRWYLSRNIDFIFFKNADARSFQTITEDYGVPFISDHYPLITYLNY